MMQLVGPTMPWWRVRMVWLVVGAPALVVVASFALLALAIRGGDRPLQRTAQVPSVALLPAAQARNHAASPRP